MKKKKGEKWKIKSEHKTGMITWREGQWRKGETDKDESAVRLKEKDSKCNGKEARGKV